VRGLRKAYGRTLAVDGIELTVPRGAFFGLVGPNGAGKTTLLSMAVGLLRPDNGTALVFGRDVLAEHVEAARAMGVMPDGFALPQRLTGWELLCYLGMLRGMRREAVAARADELLSVLGLEQAERTLVIDYSAGMRKKIGLAAALLHAPGLLVLDEPFEAVDPVSASVIRAILLRFVASGGSILLSSHVMALVESLCTHVAVVDRGRIAAVGTLDEVRAGTSLEERFTHLVGATGLGAEELAWLAP
jgi:ABC-2 type transport system ATP-binding protein